MAIECMLPRHIGRSRNESVVHTAAYNMRGVLYERREGKTHDWSRKAESLLHHEILLPPGVDPAYRDPGVLWNAADAMERRKDSVTAKEYVIPLPRNPELSHDDLIVMVREFVQKHQVDHGIPAQIDIHLDPGNPHAHVLVATRRLSDAGFAPKKALDLDPTVRFVNGHPLAVEATRWGPVWRDFQNEWFEKHGREVVVDPVHKFPQVHLGPVRFRRPDDPRLVEAAQRAILNARAAAKLLEAPSVFEEFGVKHMAAKISPQYRAAEATYRAMDKQKTRAEATVRWHEMKKRAAEHDLDSRLKQIGPIRRLAHRIGKARNIEGLQDVEAREFERRIAVHSWGLQRAAIRRTEAIDRGSGAIADGKEALAAVQQRAQVTLDRHRQIVHEAQAQIATFERTFGLQLSQAPEHERAHTPELSS